MKPKNTNFNEFFDFVNFCKNNRFQFEPSPINVQIDAVSSYKKGNKIKIKKENRGKFTEYCGGKVTSECIQRGKNSPDPKIRKRATFAANARRWKHGDGGVITLFKNRYTDFSNLFKDK